MLCRWKNNSYRNCWPLLLAVVMGCAELPDTTVSSISQQLILGGDTSCLLSQDSATTCWGEGSSGELGSGLATDTYLPQPLSDSALGSATIQILTLGDSHSCGIATNGALLCWGQAYSGQLGLGDRFARLAPTPLPTLNGISRSTQVRLVGAGRYHSCAVTEENQVLCWGFSGNGQLGNGHIDTDRSTYLSPIEVGELPYASPVVALAMGGYHSCALHSNGRVSCWGFAARGQLGNACELFSSKQNGCQHDQPRPVGVPYFDLLSPHRSARALAVGEYHSCAIAHSGHLLCWGSNSSGQLGINSKSASSRPRLVNDIADVTALSLGANHSCAIRQGGTLYCWGTNDRGQLGIRSTHSRSVPVVVTGFHPSVGGRSVLQVASGRSHTCAIDSRQHLWCWGANGSGQAGRNSQFTTLSSPQLIRRL